MSEADKILNKMWPFVRQNLVTHGHVAPVAFILKPDGLKIAGFDNEFFRSDASKHDLAVQLRAYVQQHKAIAVVLVAEAWASKLDAVETAVMRAGGVIPLAEQHANREEVISVTLQEPGRVVVGVAPITRDADGKPDTTIEPPELHPSGGRLMFFDEVTA